MGNLSSPTPDATTLTKGKIQLANHLGGTAALPTVSTTGIAAILAIAYPVGSIYMNKTVSTNPATLFGFGTWVALEGRVVVGKAASGTFVTAGATGGAETHTLSTTEMPAHNHTWRGGNTSSGGLVGSNQMYQVGLGASDFVGNTGSTLMNNTGGGGAHNNLQPYVVAYMWERTA